LHAEDFAAQTHGIFAAQTEFAFPAKKIGLDGDRIADAPPGSASVSLAFFGTRRRDGGAPRANLHDFAGDFTARRAGELDGDGQAGFFEPKIEVIQTAGLHLDDDFPGLRPRLRHIAEFKFPRRAMRDELDGFHDLQFTIYD